MLEFKSHAEVWDKKAADSYDTPGIGMYSPDVLDPAVERLRDLADGGRVLEFAIGTGRVAIPLLEKGLEVCGIEIAPAMVDRLREKVSPERLPVVLGDMTTSRASGAFSLVFLVFNAISTLPTQGQQVDCFRNAACHLQAGGRFVIELWVPELPKRPPHAQAVVGHSEDGRMVIDTYDVVAQHVVSHHFGFKDPDNITLFRSPHRYVWPSELDLMAQLAGFELESRHADWKGSPFTAASGSHVSVYRLVNNPAAFPQG
jgi:SAM-dependent methyltransferase